MGCFFSSALADAARIAEPLGHQGHLPNPDSLAKLRSTRLIFAICWKFSTEHQDIGQRQALISFQFPSPHSSGDRAPPSGGGGAGSIPAGGTIVMCRVIVDKRTRDVPFSAADNSVCRISDFMLQKLALNRRIEPR